MDQLAVLNSTPINFSQSASNIELILHQGKRIIKKTTRNYKIDQEFSITSSFNSPRIIKLFEKISNVSYTMEFCEGGDLFSNSPILDLDLLKQTCKQMAECVSIVHANGYSHLDIKLQNFARDNEGLIKLIDFGCASVSSKLITQLLGSTEYNAPERGSGSYDGNKADIYSLGICYLHLLSGVYPFRTSSYQCAPYKAFRLNPTLFWQEVSRYIKTGHPAFERINEDLKALITLMLSEKPDDRPDISEVLAHNFFHADNVIL